MPDALDGDFSRSRAVLIGTWQYRHLRPVPAAEHSLNRMTALLQSPLCGSWPKGPKGRIAVVSNRATPGNLPHELVTWFSSATDVALFYYVGHGQYDSDDRLCLSLTDSSPDPIFRTTTSLTFDAVRNAFKASEATTKIAILDCCFAGIAGLDNTLGAGGASSTRSRRRAGAGLGSGAGGAGPGPQAPELPRSPGFYLMMASNEFSTAWCETLDDAPKPQTYFTKYLADVIENGIPGQPDRLTLGSIFDKTADALVSDRKPEPGNRASNHAARYILARNAAPPETQGDHSTSVALLNAGITETNKRRQYEQHHQRSVGFRRRTALVLSVIGTVTLAGGLTAAVLTSQPPDQARVVLAGHTASVTSVVFSPDGRTLATGSEDGTARLWDVASGQQIGQPFTGHTASVWSVAFSPDGRTLATGSDDITARLWDVGSHQQLGDPLTGYTGSVSSVAFSPDGRTLATRSSDDFGIARLWDVAVHQPIGGPFGHDNLIEDVAFSPDGRTLATASSRGTAQLWDVASQQPIGNYFGATSGTVWSVAFSPDGRTLATTSQDGSARLWDVASHQQIGEPFTGHTADPDAPRYATVWSVVFSPDGRTLATAGLDKTVRLWDVGSHLQLGEPLAGHTASVNSVAFSPDGRTLATGSEDKTAGLWDVASRR